MTTNEKAAPPPAAARGDVRAVLQEMRDRHVARRFKSQTLIDWADRIEAALAAEGVQAGDVEQRAREVLATLTPIGINESFAAFAFRAIVAALSQQPEARVYQCPRCATSMEVDPTAKPEARGVVDEALAHADLCRLSRVFNAHNVPGLDQDRRINEWLGKRIAAALTGERNA